MSQTRFIIVRHGETEWNHQGRWMGQLDSPLTSTGLAQARQLADRFAGTSFDAFYSSDLGRATATSAAIAAKCSPKVVLEPRLRERHLGIFQGLTVAEMEERYPQDWAEYEKRGYDYVIPGGESARQRVERTMMCLEDLALRHRGGSVLIVTHGGILTGLFHHVLGLSPELPIRFRRPNAAVNVFAHKDGAWFLETWGDKAHLEGLRALDDSVREARR